MVVGYYPYNSGSKSMKDLPKFHHDSYVHIIYSLAMAEKIHADGPQPIPKNKKAIFEMRDEKRLRKNKDHLHNFLFAGS